jgi:hypothetical protein
MITSHIVDNIEYVGGASGFSTNLTVGDVYTQKTQTATADNGTAVLTISGNVDVNTAGTYPVIYSAVDDDLVSHDVTESVIVAVVVPNDLETDFKNGSKLRDGTDVSGTYYETAVQNAGSLTDSERAKTAAIQDESALDPYEVKD